MTRIWKGVVPKLVATLVVGALAITASARTVGDPPSAVVLPVIDQAAASFVNADSQLQAMFRNALTDAERASEVEPDGTVFVKTGDIPYEWLRDSAAEVSPYLYFAKDAQVGKFLKGVIARQAEALTRSSYSAAFDTDYSLAWDRYELDSLLYPIELAWRYWKMTGDTSVFTAKLAKGFDSALRTMLIEQNHNSQSKYSNQYLHKVPSGYTGMIWSAFRNSDGDMIYNYSIPENMMAVVVLRELAQIEADVYDNSQLAATSSRLSAEVDAGIRRFGIVETKDFGSVYAYEVDGLGHHVLMDDANIPSLLAAPYVGYVSATDSVYLNTRRLLLSPADPNFYSGKLASGIGCGNTPSGTIWPLSLVAEGLTATDQATRDRVLKYLLASDPGDHYLHESFNVNDQHILTRRDFVWPNSLFAQFIMQGFLGYRPLPHL